MFKFTLESIGKIAFGVKFNALHQERSSLLLSSALDLDLPSQHRRVWFADYFDYCQGFVNESFMDPLWLLKRYFSPAGWLFFWKSDSSLWQPPLPHLPTSPPLPPPLGSTGSTDSHTKSSEIAATQSLL
jgi:hypothetical protein